ncbi:MAG: leucine-rich repeat domain-containing protein [Sphingobacteriales bacterium]|nr:leucine-rich repeat domain-containing protein [Sphingobacteriales bacterium]
MRHLHLNHNQIDVLPSSIENLTQLQSLSLKDNSLDNLPEAICELSALQELLLNNNKIQKLPRHLVNLFKLKNIEVEQNPLIFPPLEVAQQGIFALKHYLRCEAKLIEGKKINIRKIEAPATFWTSALMFYFSYLPWFLKEVKKVDAVITTTASEKGIIIEAELCDSMDLALYQQYLSEFLNLMYWEKPTYSHNIQSYNNTYESRKHWLVVHNMLLHLEAMMLLFGTEKEQFEQFMAKSEIHQRNNERLMRPPTTASRRVVAAMLHNHS